MVPTEAAAVRARFGCSAAHRRWAAFSVAASGHSVSNRERSPAPSVLFPSSLTVRLDVPGHREHDVRTQCRLGEQVLEALPHPPLQ